MLERILEQGQAVEKANAAEADDDGQEDGVSHQGVLAAGPPRDDLLDGSGSVTGGSCDLSGAGGQPRPGGGWGFPGGNGGRWRGLGRVELGDHNGAVAAWAVDLMAGPSLIARDVLATLRAGEFHFGQYYTTGQWSAATEPGEAMPAGRGYLSVVLHWA